MALQTGRNFVLFPRGGSIDTLYFSDGTTATTVTPNADGSTPPGAPAASAIVGATVTYAASAPAPAAPQTTP